MISIIGSMFSLSWFHPCENAERTYNLWSRILSRYLPNASVSTLTRYLRQRCTNALIAYSWPGNVRELQNLIERAVIRSDNGVLPNPLPRSTRRMRTPRLIQTAHSWDSQRALILQALRAAGGMIGGPRGAAARLGLKRTTLVSKMKRLGIYRTAETIDLMDEFNQSELADVTH